MAMKPPRASSPGIPASPPGSCEQPAVCYLQADYRHDVTDEALEGLATLASKGQTGGRVTA